jgi:hypothetical protein
MSAVGGPEATTGREDYDQRVEKISCLINYVREAFVVSVGKIALKGCGLDLANGKNGK